MQELYSVRNLHAYIRMAIIIYSKYFWYVINLSKLTENLKLCKNLNDATTIHSFKIVFSTKTVDQKAKNYEGILAKNDLNSKKKIYGS